MTSPSVFISYSQDSDEHKDRILHFADRLRDDGIDANLDQYQIAPPEGWQLWMEKEIRDSQFVLLVCTETYLKRVMKEDSGKGLGVMWESTIIYQNLYNMGLKNEKFIPIVFGRDNTKHIPMLLQPTSHYDVSTEEGYELLYRRLTNQPYIAKPKLGATKKLPQRERKTGTSEVKVSLAKLPSTSADLFGREKILKQLDDVWNNQDINVVSLVAWGGVGKSALVNKWLSQMAKDNYRGAERVYGWSFYSQGAAEGRQVSADQFIAAALTWFGDPEMANSSASPWDKGERLAELIKAQRTLLILDGLEPLQNPPPVETGKIKDPGLTSLLRELARQNPGLVVISTRLAVDDLKDFIGSTAIEIDLEALSDEAGSEYLKHLGVDGTDEERKEATKDFGGHALALTLMGSYLKVVHRGDVRKYKEIPHLTDEKKQGAHARRVMESYELWLKGKPELDILRLMGVFDRPATRGAVDALRKPPTIRGLTNALQKLKDVDWQYAIKNLRDLRLISQADPYEPDILDCHPLLREHFGEKLKTKNLSSWRKAHDRLFEYYKSVSKELPDTVEEMTLLYMAVVHGCMAGRYQDAIMVYSLRILRRSAQFSWKKLGLFSADLAMLSGFFDFIWYQPVNMLSEFHKSFVLNQAGLYLRALGRLSEAIMPLEAALNGIVKQDKWNSAAAIAGNLGELMLLIGHIARALEYASRGVVLADRSGVYMEQVSERTVLADVMHQAGDFAKAEAMFHDAEELQKKNQHEFLLLYSLRGFQYCDLLLSKGQYREVLSRASETVELAKQNLGKGFGYDDIGHDYLSLGHAHLLQSQSEQGFPLTESLNYLNLAMDNLRQTGTQEFIARGLLVRAELLCIKNEPDKVQKDLDEAFSIATRCGMGLYLADCHLEYARLYLVKGEKVKAREHWQIAKDSIEKMGYHRRDKEVQELEEQLK